MSSNKHSKDTNSDNHEVESPERRDMVYYLAAGTGAIATGAVAWMFVDQMNPDAAALAEASIELDISQIEVGQTVKVLWRGKPVFVRRRTSKEIAEARDVSLSQLIDPATDASRVKEGKDEWLVMIGVCTHLGCIPLGLAGNYNGWFCPCHGSHYDTSGRVRIGPAPTNLVVPPYNFVNDSLIKIG